MYSHWWVGGWGDGRDWRIAMQRLQTGTDEDGRPTQDGYIHGAFSFFSFQSTFAIKDVTLKFVFADILAVSSRRFLSLGRRPHFNGRALLRRSPGQGGQGGRCAEQDRVLSPLGRYWSLYSTPSPHRHLYGWPALDGPWRLLPEALGVAMRDITHDGTRVPRL